MSYLQRTLERLSDRQDSNGCFDDCYHCDFWDWATPNDIHYQRYKAGICDCFMCRIGWFKKGNDELPLAGWERNIFFTMFLMSLQFSVLYN